MNIFFKKLNPNDNRAHIQKYLCGWRRFESLFRRPKHAVDMAPGEQATVPTGIAVSVPYGMIGFVIACDDLGCRSGLVPANNVGVIGAGYLDEIVVCLRNQSEYVHRIVNGDRIAQIVFVPYERGEFVCQDIDDKVGGLNDDN